MAYSLKYSQYCHNLDVRFNFWKEPRSIYRQIKRPKYIVILRNVTFVQWLGLEPFASRGWGPIPGGGPRILHAVWHPTPSKRVTFDP